MKFCSCGEPADGQCVMGGEYVCRRERGNYSTTLAEILTQAGGQPPAWARRGVICPACYSQSVRDALPVALPYLRSHVGSPEHVAAWLAEGHGRWKGGSMYDDNRLADELIPAVFGSRPPWLVRGPSESMGALYATLARQRGMTPPRITVIQKETRNTPTMFHRHKRTEFTTTAGSFDAWHFHYADPERGYHKLVLVGLLGVAFEPGDYDFPNKDGQIFTGMPLDSVQAHIARTASRLAEPAGPHSFLAQEAAPVLARAVKQLL